MEIDDEVELPDFEAMRQKILAIENDNIREELLADLSVAEDKFSALAKALRDQVRVIRSKVDEIETNLNINVENLSNHERKIDETQKRLAQARRAISRSKLESVLLGISIALFLSVMADYGIQLLNFMALLFSKIFAGAANAAEINSSIANSKDYILLSILAVVSIIYIACFFILVFVSEKDSKEFAKDIIKTITGFYLGLITKGF